MEQHFTARLVAKGPKGAWTHLIVPLDTEAVFGSKARIPVVGTLNGIAFRNSIMPVGDGTHYMNINHELKAAAAVQAGDLVDVTMALDKAKREAEVPEDLIAALNGNEEAAAFFGKLAYSHKKAYTDWIISAKKAETRAGRIAKAIEMMTAGKRIG